MSGQGALRERLRDAWGEIRENLGRSVLQSLGVMLGVASVLGGFSLTDSMRKQSHRMYVKMGGLDRLNIQPNAVVKDGQPSALQAANLGLRTQDAEDGRQAAPESLSGISVQRQARARVRSAYGDQDRQVTGIAEDYLPAEGYAIAQGRGFSASEMAEGAPVAILGTEAVETFFPDGHAVGQVLRVGDVPVTVVGTLQYRVFRFRSGNRNFFRRKNRIVALPAGLVQRRFVGDDYRRLDKLTFRIPELSVMETFSKNLSTLLKANHRLQDDFRMDDVGARVRKEEKQSNVYDLIFVLSGVLALLGGGMVNVNIQLAALKERVREVGLKMALGASRGEIFLGFMTEALMLTALGGLLGLVGGVGMAWSITGILGVPLWMNASSFTWALILAFLFGFLFAIFPAWRASRLSPMEALRYE